MQKKLIKNQQVEIEIPFEDINNNTIPLYNLYAAAGSFSEMQDEKEFSLKPVPERYKTEDYFACKVCGESMNKIISNNSKCIFKKYFAGSRSGKILLIYNRSSLNPAFNSAFTVKTCSGKKTISEKGNQRTKNLLKPNYNNTSFKNIIVNEENSKQMKVHGEFVCAIN